MRNRLAGWILGVAIAVSALDIVATYVAIHTNIGSEQNPIAASMMETFGVGLTLIAGFALRVSIVGMLSRIWAGAGYLVARRTAGVVLVAVALWWTLVAIHTVGVVATQ